MKVFRYIGLCAFDIQCNTGHMYYMYTVPQVAVCVLVIVLTLHAGLWIGFKVCEINGCVDTHTDYTHLARVVSVLQFLGLH